MTQMPPRAVLSEHMEEALRGRRLVAGVFLTFKFDPAFFEQEILPTFFDIPLSQAPAIKLAQLEEPLREVRDGVAVYFDRNGLTPEAGAGRLDVRRIPMLRQTGIFHPKNIFALVEEPEPDDNGHHRQAMTLATLSANLTRAGWWQNVEACHTEEIKEGDSTRLRDPLLRFLSDIKRSGGDKSPDGHRALEAVRSFLKKTEQKTQKSSNQLFHTHFYDGRGGVPQFIAGVAGRSVHGMNLEVISPYFDEAASALPIEDLLDKTKPAEIRVYLPRDESGAGLCSEDVHETIRNWAGIAWGRLPPDLLRSGKQDGAKLRTVHAKVYRFFEPSPGREILFIGSPNLTSAAHRGSANLETGILVETGNPRPDWWLTLDRETPDSYVTRQEDEGTAASGGTPLALRFWWNTKAAEAYWDSDSPSPALALGWQGIDRFTLTNLEPRKWVSLDATKAANLEEVLRSTSILSVTDEDGSTGYLLVQEEGMHARPSLLFDLTPAEILRYWALLTPAQKAEFLNARAPELAQTDEGAALLVQAARVSPENTFFDRFAGIFLAFGCLERAVNEALPDNPKKAAHLLFGQKYDSLPNLVNKVSEEFTQGKGDTPEQYVTLLCVRQVLTALRKGQPEFFREYHKEAAQLETQLEVVEFLRQRLAEKGNGMTEFLDWFEPWFLKRAKPVEAGVA